jgi:hypothetical protein
MLNDVKNLIINQQQEIEKLRNRIDHLKQQNVFLSVKLFDHKYTIKQLKEKLQLEEAA